MRGPLLGRFCSSLFPPHPCITHPTMHHTPLLSCCRRWVRLVGRAALGSMQHPQQDLRPLTRLVRLHLVDVAAGPTLSGTLAAARDHCRLLRELRLRALHLGAAGLGNGTLLPAADW